MTNGDTIIRLVACFFFPFLAVLSLASDRGFTIDRDMSKSNQNVHGFFFDTLEIMVII